MRYAMIMAGGAGTRLWPMSRQQRPKPLLPIIGGRSLLALAVERLEGLVPPERRYICTAESLRPAIRAALPGFADDRILGEPMGRNTLNAIGLTAAVLAGDDPDAVFAVLTADHVIEPAEEFRRRVDLGLRLAEDDPRRFVTFAIRPTHPATGYGYVERGAPIDGAEQAFHVARFVEKPDLETARSYVAQDAFGWNSGMFVFHAGQYLEALAAFEPEAHRGLSAIGAAWSGPDRGPVLDRVYPTLPRVSVDYGVMEPAARDERFSLCCVPMELSWLDVGSWASLREILEQDASGCGGNARVVHLDSHRVTAVSDDPDHLVATIGCGDLIVVHTRDVTLVCPATEAERVKTLVERLDGRYR